MSLESEIKKLFYTDPLQAAYMAKGFGVKFNAQGLGEILFDIDKYGLMSWGYRSGCGEYHQGPFHIHPDSLHIFEPQVDDFLSFTNDDGDEVLGDKFVEMDGNAYVCKRFDRESLTWETVSWGEKSFNAVVKRDNKPFFTPETEE